MNGWLLAIGPGSGPLAVRDRQVARALNCIYGSYGEAGDWLCQHCGHHIRWHQLQRGQNNSWLHGPCAAHGPIIPPWGAERTISTVLYNYHASYCARADVLDDIRKTAMLGLSVYLDLHDLVGAEYVEEHVAGAICHTDQDAERIQGKFKKVAVVRHMWPQLDADPVGGWPAAKITCQHRIGWHGAWRPDKQVHLIIQAVAKLRSAGQDVGLIAVGGQHQIGGTPLVSGLAYADYCQSLAAALKVQDVCQLISAACVPTGELVAALRQCTMICLPGRSARAGPLAWGGSSSAALCLSLHKPVMLTKTALTADLIQFCCPLSKETTTDEITSAVSDLIRNRALREHFETAARYISFHRQPRLAVAGYLSALT